MSHPEFSIPAGMTLMEGEKLLYYGRMAWSANFWLLLFGVLTIWIGVGVIFILVAFLRRRGSEYLITNKRIYSKYGLISRSTNEARMEWVTNVMVRQGFIARLFNVGDVIIETPSGPIGSVWLRGLKDPMHVRSIVLDWAERVRKIQNIRMKLERVEEEYELGRISEEEYRRLREKYEREMSMLES